jgi:hypothetical protein
MRGAYVLRPFPIPEIQPFHSETVFEDVGVTIRRRLAELATVAPTPFVVQLREVLQELLPEIDADRFAEVQRRFITDAAGAALRPMLKFFDTPFWVEGKMRIAWRLGLQKPPRLRVLDLGTGAGHFPLIARLWGHSVVGTDLPPAESASAALFTALRAVFKVPCHHGVIQAFCDLPPFDTRFDLITALLVNFQDRDGKIWGSAAWDHFLNDLRSNLLAPGGRIYLQLTDLLTPEPQWRHLSDQAEWRDEKSKQLLLR